MQPNHKHRSSVASHRRRCLVVLLLLLLRRCGLLRRGVLRRFLRALGLRLLANRCELRRRLLCFRLFRLLLDAQLDVKRLALLLQLLHEGKLLLAAHRGDRRDVHAPHERAGRTARELFPGARGRRRQRVAALACRAPRCGNSVNNTGKTICTRPNS